MNPCTHRRKRKPQNHQSVLKTLLWIHCGKLDYFLDRQVKSAGWVAASQFTTGALSPPSFGNWNQEHLTLPSPAKLQTQAQHWSCLNVSAKKPQLAQNTESPWGSLPTLWETATIAVAEPLLPDHSVDIYFCPNPFIQYRWSYCPQCFWSFSVI